MGLFDKIFSGPTQFLKKLTQLETQLRAGEDTFEKIHDLVLKLQDVESREQFEEYQEKVLPSFIPLLSLLVEESEKRKKVDPDFDDRDADIFTMKMLAGFQSPEGIEAIAKLMKRNYKSDDYFWTAVLNYYIEDQALAEIIVNTLDGKLPEGFLRVVYLDMLNKVSLKNETFGPHPFSSSEGVAILEKYLKNENEEEFSYAISATAALPYLSENAWKKLLPVALKHPDASVRLEAFWAGTKLGDTKCRDGLIDMAKSYVHGQRAVEYLEELGLEEFVPEESKTWEFAALAEMSSWLSHPSEFGAYPTELTLVDSRTLFWPPTQDERRLTIVRYRYEKWNSDGSDEIGVGLVGSVTFCLFGVVLNESPPEEVYAIHCAWEMQKKNYKNPKVGLAELQGCNPGFGKPEK